MKKTILICLLAVMLCSMALTAYAATEPSSYDDYEEFEDELVETEEYFDIEETISEIPEETAPDLPQETTLSTDETGNNQVPAPTQTAAGNGVTTTGINAIAAANNTTTDIEDLLVPIACITGGVILVILSIILFASSKKKSK